MPGETDATEIAALALTDYVSLDYVQPAEAGLDTAPVNLWIAYYASQKFGRSVHSPQFCIPGSGWTIDRLDVISADVPASGGTRRLPVNRAVISKGAARQLVFYWFKERGRSEANEYAVKFHILVDAIESGRTDGALVRLVTPLLPGAGGEAAADRRLRNMTALIAPLLPRYIPD
jgi:EpsI family protein